MAIACTCPKCGRFCGFKDAYAGRCARCLACSAHFMIPSQDGQKAILTNSEAMPPMKGFYTKVFRRTAAAFAQKDSFFGIILCVALTTFHFITGNLDYSFSLPGFRMQLSLGWLATFICAGYLLWYFMETINITIMEYDILPEIFIGTGFTFIGESIKSIYLFASAFAVAAIPGAAVTALLEKCGIVSKPLNLAMIMLSMTMLPMMLGMLGSGVPPWKLFRYDLIWRIIIGFWKPYLLTAVITFAALLSVYLTVGYFSSTPDMSKVRMTLMLPARLASVFLTVFAMRTIGLFALHYFRCFPSLWKTPGDMNP